MLSQPALYGLSLFTFSFGARRAIDTRLGGSSDPTAPRGGGVYVRKSVHAYDSKGVSVRRLGPPSSTEEHELSVAPRTTPSVRIFVEQQSLSVTEYDEPDLEAGKSSAGPEWRSEWRGEKSWEAPPV